MTCTGKECVKKPCVQELSRDGSESGILGMCEGKPNMDCHISMYTKRISRLHVSSSVYIIKTYLSLYIIIAICVYIYI